MDQSVNSLLKQIPSVDSLLQTDALLALAQHYGHNPVRDAARRELEALRQSITASAAREQNVDELLSHLCARIELQLVRDNASTLRPVFNLTGTIIHTNLGRSLLPESAIQALVKVASHPVTLEYDLNSASRGDRDTHVESLICELTGAEAATVVNNNAAAVLLVLNTLAQGREVIISRGELVEIGGSFRIPDVMHSAGCMLTEIGTTNRTHESDYRTALTANTALLMKVHTSNYAIQGFTAAATIAQTAAIARENNLPLVCDLGSGTLVDLRQFGLPHELTVREVLEQGADVVTFSGDKLLGGPQSGIIAGKKQLIDQIKRNPLKRTLRVDKLILAALVEVLRLYKDPQRLPERLPVFRDLTRPLAEIEAMGKRLLSPMQRAFAGIADVELGSCMSQVGSGAVPSEFIPSAGFVLKVQKHAMSENQSLQELANQLRAFAIPVIGRIQNNSLILDIRCLNDEEAFRNQLGK